VTIHREYDWDRDLVTITVTEPWSVGEFVQDILERAKRGEQQPPLALVDCRQVATIPTQGEISGITQVMNVNRDMLSRRRAILVSSKLHYGMGRMASIYAEINDIEMDVFTDRAEALAWLGLDPPAP
jgi:hypothetical protein